MLDMSPNQKKIFGLLLVMALAAFFLYSRPNAAASQNTAMVQMFEPDEAAPLPYLLHMVSAAPSVTQALKNFVFYNYYYYGFPYFAISALAILPLQLLGRIGDLPLVMLVLRQVVSVLPMLAALLLLVYLLDGFRTYRSPVLFVLLLSVPAVLANSFWWHPDSLTFLLVMLTLFFLKRDALRLGWNFILAAVMTGAAAATKLIGVDFFLAVGIALGLALASKKVSWKRTIGMALAYLLVMGVSFVAANPFLLSHWARTGYLNTINQQADLLSSGYGVVYAKGLLASWPFIRQYFGEALFLLAALGTLIWGTWRGGQRLLYALILAWLAPVTFTVLYISHFKYQYWMPAALPLIASLVIAMPEKLILLRKKNAIAVPSAEIASSPSLLTMTDEIASSEGCLATNVGQALHPTGVFNLSGQTEHPGGVPSLSEEQKIAGPRAEIASSPSLLAMTYGRVKQWLLPALVLVVVAVQFVLFAANDVQSYTTRLHRADNNEIIQFYNQAVTALQPLPDASLHVYYDYRLYVPGKPGWSTETSYDLLEYGYIQQHNFDVLILLQQRIYDYLNPNAKGVDPQLFKRNQQFYGDANQGAINGYHLVHRDAVGLIFVRNDLYQQYFK